MNVMDYFPKMEKIPEDLMHLVLKESENYQADTYTDADVLEALSKDALQPKHLGALLSSKASEYLELIIEKASKKRQQYFGNNVFFFSPLYLSNLCDNHCTYCGFNCHSDVSRHQLNLREIHKEMEAMAETGLEEVLILTGESHKFTPINYIAQGVEIAHDYFKNVGLEIYPCNTTDYRVLQKAGADFVTVFQETYNPEVYDKYHLSGHKRSFPYRFNAQERAILAGMRGVAFAPLFGLYDYRKEAYATGLHAYFLQRKYPHIEISFSCPRIRPAKGSSATFDKNHLVSERDLAQILAAWRLFMPFASITISTRERAKFRDLGLQLFATKVSAGVSTGIGKHQEENEEKGGDQFEIADTRSLEVMIEDLKRQGLQPILNDYVYLGESYD